MRPSLLAGCLFGATALGVGIGVLVAGHSGTEVTATRGGTEVDPLAPRSAVRRDDAHDAPVRDAAEARRALARRASADEVDAANDDRDRGKGGASREADGPAGVTSEDDVETLSREVAALRRENRELREEHTELLGEPMQPPADLEPRFAGPTVSASVGQAIGQAGIEGKVEHVDCAEYPCITFGRLAGDEEDMEEIERAAALSPYDADVLTLLFWATTVDSSDAPGTQETGLFAIAFYSQDDRANDGAALDRRIRARTVEYWNTDRPARPPSAALD